MELAARLGVLVAAQPSIHWWNGAGLRGAAGPLARAPPTRSAPGSTPASRSAAAPTARTSRSTRGSASGRRGPARCAAATGPHEPELALDAGQALALYTTGAAAVSLAAGRRGALRPGLAADWAVLSVDPLTAAPAELRTMTVLETAVGGATRPRATRPERALEPFQPPGAASRGRGDRGRRRHRRRRGRGAPGRRRPRGPGARGGARPRPARVGRLAAPTWSTRPGSAPRSTGASTPARPTRTRSSSSSARGCSAAARPTTAPSRPGATAATTTAGPSTPDRAGATDELLPLLPARLRAAARPYLRARTELTPWQEAWLGAWVDAGLPELRRPQRPRRDASASRPSRSTSSTGSASTSAFAYLDPLRGDPRPDDRRRRPSSTACSSRATRVAGVSRDPRRRRRRRSGRRW